MPVWEAQYTLVIASKTGWKEHFIRHELPLSRGLAYYHAARVMEGERCRWPGQPTAISKWVDTVFQRIRKLTHSTRTK